MGWELWYRDTFDLTDPASVDATGEDLVSGLSALWRSTLHGGVAVAGNRTFASFTLGLPDGSVHVPVPITGRDPVLARLRAWVFPPLPAGMRAPVPRNDACESAPHGEDSAVLLALVRLHLELAGEPSAPALHAAAAQLLERVAPLDAPAELHEVLAQLGTR